MGNASVEDLDRAGLCASCSVIFQWVGLPLVRDAMCPRAGCGTRLSRGSSRNSPHKRVFELPLTVAAMTGVAGQMSIDCAEREIGQWLGRGPDGHAQRIVACPACGANAVRFLVRRQGTRGRECYAHVIRTDHYEKICVPVPASSWRSSSMLRNRLGVWLEAALATERAALQACEPRPAITPLKSIAHRLGTTWQVLRSLPRCAKLPPPAFREALEADMRAQFPDGPAAILAADWAAAPTQMRRWPS